MATTFFAWTFPVHTHCVSEQFSCLDDVADLLNTAYLNKTALMYASRNDKAAWIIKEIYPIYCAFGLSFIGKTLAVLDAKQIADAIHSIENMFLLVERNPLPLLSFTEVENTEDILEALLHSKMAENPDAGPVGEENGDGPWYVFSYLKSLVALFRYAQSNNLSIIHVRHEH